MLKRWWEDFVWFVCDWWWLILIVLAVGLGAYFTRNLWLPLLVLAS